MGAIREYNFINGPTTPVQPTADESFLAPKIQGTGTRASPQSITAAGGIPFTGNSMFNVIFVQGTGAGTTIITANPRIQAGSFLGQKLKVVQRSAANILRINDGQGVESNGDMVLDDTYKEINYWFDGVNWKEDYRNA